MSRWHLFWDIWLLWHNDQSVQLWGNNHVYLIDLYPWAFVTGKVGVGGQMATCTLWHCKAPYMYSYAILQCKGKRKSFYHHIITLHHFGILMIRYIHFYLYPFLSPEAQVNFYGEFPLFYPPSKTGWSKNN